MDELTPREQDIARLMVNGLSTREIAEELFLAYSTVRSYIRDLYSKLYVHSFEEAVDKIMALGLLSDNYARIRSNHNFPALTSPLIGRQPELDIIATRLTDQTTRLITLLGPGGMGKTRLALEVGWVHRAIFTDGAYFIALQPLQNPHHILNAIADALPVQIRDEDDLLAQLQEYLSPRHMLLVLDNVEHLLDGGVQIITDLLLSAPNLWLLVTSREALNVRDEWLLALNGLSYPAQLDDEAVLSAPAIQLFTERAQRLRPDFDVAAEAEAMLEICHLVEGLPLALEIAASWTKIATCDSIVDQIRAGLNFLASRFRDMPARHRSMQAVFDHSWHLLTEHEQQVLPRLAIFRGGFTREAALTVAGATWADLISLVEKSLIRVESAERYGMHELLRQYAQKQLREEESAVLAAHCSYFTAFMVEREADIKGRRQLAALDEIEADFENVRMAWLFAVDQQDDDTLEAMLESLYWYCELRHRLAHSQELLRNAWEKIDSTKYPLLWARLRAYYTNTVNNIWGQPTMDRERFVSNLWALIDPCWEIAHLHKSPYDIAFCEMIRGKIQHDAVHTQLKSQRSGGFGTSIKALENSLHLYTELGDEFYIAFIEYKLFWVYWMSAKPEEANTASQRSYALAKKIGDTIRSGHALNIIADRYTMQTIGDYEGALQQFQEVQQIAYETGDGYLASINGQNLCRTLWTLGRFIEAEQFARNLLPAIRDINEGLHEATLLQYLSLCYCMREDYIQAENYAVASRNLVTDRTEWEKSIIYWPKVVIAIGQDDYETLKQCLHLLLRLAIGPTYGLLGDLINPLPFAPFWLAHIGQAENAASIMGLMNQHPAESAVRWTKKWPAYQRLRQRLETDLEPDDFAAAYNKGATLDLQTVVKSVGELLS